MHNNSFPPPLFELHLVALAGRAKGSPKLILRRPEFDGFEILTMGFFGMNPLAFYFWRLSSSTIMSFCEKSGTNPSPSTLTEVE